MLRDVFVTSIIKGQALLVGFLFIVVLIIIKVPADDLSALISDFYGSLKNGFIAGYVLWVSTTIGWFYHSKFQRRQHAAEIDRVSSEKSNWQQKALSKKVSSTKK